LLFETANNEQLKVHVDEKETKTVHKKAKPKKTSVESQQGTNDDDSSLGLSSTDSEREYSEFSDASILGWPGKEQIQSGPSSQLP